MNTTPSKKVVVPNADRCQRTPHFADSEMKYCEFKTCWRGKIRKRESSCQTKKSAVTKNKTCQAFKHRNVQTQTPPRSALWKRPVVDEASLAKFLKKVTPIMLEELSLCQASWSYIERSVMEVVPTLEEPKLKCVLTSEVAPTGSSVSGISWNSTGTMIAVSYSYTEHISWCNHQGFVTFWNPCRRNFNPGMPSSHIQVTSCVTCIKFHPSEAFILGLGTYSGGVSLWDLSENPTLVSSTNDGNFGHEDQVTGITWITDSDSKEVVLCTCGRDGYVILWCQEESELKTCFWMEVNSVTLPPRMRPRMAYGQPNLGLSCVTFNAEDADLFIVGTDQGGLAQCSLCDCELLQHSSNARQDAVNETVFPYDPVKFFYKPHVGALLAADHSPFSRYSFLSCSSDGQVRLYNTIQPLEPVLTLHLKDNYGRDVKWSPVRPMLCAVGDASGAVHFYDFYNNHNFPVKILKESPDIAVTVLSFSANSDILAVGDESGSVRLWQLPDCWTITMDSELEVLHSLVLHKPLSECKNF